MYVFKSGYSLKPAGKASGSRPSRSEKNVAKLLAFIYNRILDNASYFAQEVGKT